MRRLVAVVAAGCLAGALVGSTAYAAESHNFTPVKSFMLAKNTMAKSSKKKQRKPVTVKIGKKSFKCYLTPVGVQCGCVEVCNYFGCAPMCR